MSDDKKRTITLTDRAPVRILESEWPVVASGDHDEHDGQVRCQANRTTEITIRVRQHTDGRAVVYGIYDYSSNFEGEANLNIRAGELCAVGADLAAAIRAVGTDVIAQLDGRGNETAVRDVINECIADLPAVDL